MTLVSCSSLQSKNKSKIEVKVSVSGPEFEKSFAYAKNRLTIFAKENGWESLVNEKSFIEKVEVFSSKAEFDIALQALSNGQMKSVPKNFVAVMDNRILRVIAWKRSYKIFTRQPC